MIVRAPARRFLELHFPSHFRRDFLDFHSDSEDGGEDFEEGEDWLASLIPLRSDLLAGDFRFLYLAWLAGVHHGEVDRSSAGYTEQILAHVWSRSRHRVGRYRVEPEQLEPLVREALTGPGAVDACLIDEVGKMELFCPAFVEVIPRLLEGAVPVVLTVAQKGQGLIAQVKARADVHLATVTDENRDGQPEELERWLRDPLRSQ